MNWKAITYSTKSDSVLTIDQILENNARREAACKTWGASRWGH